MKRSKFELAGHLARQLSQAGPGVGQQPVALGGAFVQLGEGDMAALAVAVPHDEVGGPGRLYILYLGPGVVKSRLQEPDTAPKATFVQVQKAVLQHMPQPEGQACEEHRQPHYGQSNT